MGLGGHQADECVGLRITKVTWKLLVSEIMCVFITTAGRKQWERASAMMPSLHIDLMEVGHGGAQDSRLDGPLV